MRFLILAILTGVLSFLTQNFLPWWGFVAVTALITLAGQPTNRKQSFLIGFVGIAAYWGILAFALNSANHGILLERIGELLVGIGSEAVLAVTILIGGLFGGLGGVVGREARQLVVAD